MKYEIDIALQLMSNCVDITDSDDKQQQYWAVFRQLSVLSTFSGE